MASADTENNGILKVGVHTCSDDAVGNIHVQDYAQFELLDSQTIELTHTVTSFHHETDEITESFFKGPYNVKNEEVI